MNLLRKIGKWCWDKKERMVLVAMLLFLGFRIYTVVRVPDAAEQVAVVPPKKTPPEAGGLPPKASKVVEEVDLPSLIRRPIGIWESPGRSNSDNASNAEDEKLELLLIIEKDDGNHLARFTTGGKKTLVAENESFESYTLLSIDVEGETCLVYSENSNSNILIELKK